MGIQTYVIVNSQDDERNIKYITLQSQRVEFITTNNNYTGNGMSTVAVEYYFQFH